MSQQSFDAFTRQAAAAISRRRSLAALGGAGAALAVLANPAITTAKKGGKKKKKKDPNKKCKRQVEQCKDFIEDLCEEQNTDPEECEETLACCEFLGQCSATAFLQCLVAVQ